MLDVLAVAKFGSCCGLLLPWKKLLLLVERFVEIAPELREAGFGGYGGGGLPELIDSVRRGW